MVESPDKGSDWLSADAVARHRVVKPVVVYRWCRQGILRCLKLGKSWRIRRTDLDACPPQRLKPQTFTDDLDQVLSRADQVLAVAEDSAFPWAYDAACFQVGQRHSKRLRWP